MYSFDFPSMLNSNTAKLVKNKDAVRSNVLLLLQSEKKTLLGDPFFGSRLKRMLFEQSNSLIADLVIDEIYTTLTTFIPQIYLTRKDIELLSDRNDIYVTVKYIYLLDNTQDLYTISLTSDDSTEA